MAFNPKLTGSFYTSNNIAEYLVNWSIRSTKDILLEPCFGDGAFLDAILNNPILQSINQIYAVEIREEPFKKYVQKSELLPQNCFYKDFLHVDPFAVDAVIGNPPYVRLRNLKNFDCNQYIQAIEILNNKGIKISTNASVWVAFILHSMHFLKKGGRLAFVLPFEATYVKYAMPLWKYLGDNFNEINVARIHEDIFPEVDVETILFMADGFGGKTESVNYVLCNNKDDLFNDHHIKKVSINIDSIVKGNKPFVFEILNRDQQLLLNKLKIQGLISSINKDCRFKIGYVSAAKDYFHPSDEVIGKFNLPKTNFIGSVCNAKQLSSTGLYLYPQEEYSKLYYPIDITDYDLKYIQYGELLSIDKRYKCTKRNPWYITPNIEIPDIVATVFGEMPKLLINKGKFAASNSLLCGFIQNPNVTPENLACRWYNSLTLLSIELQIHSLGGGVLVLIPGEVGALYIPDTGCFYDYKHIRTIESCLKSQKVGLSYEAGDYYILQKFLKINTEQLNLIRDAIDTLRWWRNPIYRKHGSETKSLFAKA
ncbi:Eco57I restriction-modification methylase domain-containing protein [Desulfotruncus alcoholivorax]|uniref:Eco57I restriction-modification methylase domain-containing protein n=1 Tax=Desulfotruncus alcoholivorax TaxID=265477 RepID=UPI0004275755|nr:N-6 DNA methylase [Desulfotruncus alcoholivorax]